MQEFNDNYEDFQEYLRNRKTQALNPPEQRKFSNEFSPPDMILYYGPGVHQVDHRVHLIHHYLDPFEPKPLCAIIYLKTGETLFRHYCHQYWPERHQYNTMCYGTNIPAPDTTDCNLPCHYMTTKQFVNISTQTN